MRALTVTLVLFCAIVPTLAQKRISSKITSDQCPVPAHAHRYSDVRVAEVEVNRVDSCGFGFVDLENNSVGIENSMQFSNDFCLTRLEGNKPESVEYRVVKLSRKEIKKGMRGAAIYCGSCKTVFVLRLDHSNKRVAMR